LNVFNPIRRLMRSDLFPGPLDDKARRTFANDCLRQLFTGLSDTGPKTFFLLIAVRHFSAGDLYKTLVSVPGSLGMTLSVILLPLLSGSAKRKTYWLAIARVLTGICFLIAAAWPTLQAYVFWVLIGSLPGSIAYPLLTSVYNENYPRRIRGQLFAWASMVNMGSCAIASWVFGFWLGKHAEHYQSILAAFATANFLAAWSIARMPSQNQSTPPGRSFLHAFRWIRHDRAFAYMLGVWFIFGFGIFMMSPLKVLYLTEARYGRVYSTATVAFIVGFLPEIFRMLTTPIWARLFDRYHFVGIRMSINLILLASMVAFFVGRTMPWLITAAVLEGMCTGGGNISWALWVTHVAPTEHTTEYMSVNQFFTGFRGIVGTFAGIRLASIVGLQEVAWFTIALVVLSILMMIPMRGDRRWIRGEALREGNGAGNG
jgi:MFS family permease